MDFWKCKGFSAVLVVSWLMDFLQHWSKVVLQLCQTQNLQNIFCSSQHANKHFFCGASDKLTTFGTNFWKHCQKFICFKNDFSKAQIDSPIATTQCYLMGFQLFQNLNLIYQNYLTMSSSPVNCVMSSSPVNCMLMFGSITGQSTLNCKYLVSLKAWILSTVLCITG